MSTSSRLEWQSNYPLQGASIGTTKDIIDACDDLQRAQGSSLFASQIGVIVSEISATAPFETHPLLDGTHLNQHVIATRSGLNKQQTRIYVVPQEHSRAPLDITLSGLDSLFGALKPFPSVSKIITAFSTSGSDSYLGRNAAHFVPHVEPTSTPQILEMCCLLKYVEENYRKGGLSKWSVRQMGFYQQYNCIDKLDTSILFHPSDMFWGRIKAEMKDNPNGEPTWGHWTSMPLLLFKSLSANWQDYVTFLHDKAVAISTDTSFTDPKRQRAGEANNESLKICSAHLDALNVASHALQANRAVLETVQIEAKKRRTWACSKSDSDCDVFEGVIADVIRETRATDAHVKFILERLERTSTTIRDLMSMRNTYTIEQMTSKSIEEARAVRIVSLVASFFLPASFTSSFMAMNYIHVTHLSPHGYLNLSADADLWVYLALTLPLMLLTVGGWFLWECFSARKRKKTENTIV